jgi:hypothetical protein
MTFSGRVIVVRGANAGALQDGISWYNSASAPSATWYLATNALAAALQWVNCGGNACADNTGATGISVNSNGCATNANGSPLPSALMFAAFDRYLGATGTDWVDKVKQRVEGAEKQAKDAQKAIESQRVMGTSPSLALEKYAGTYADSMYGDAVVTMENGHLVARIGPPVVADLEHWHFTSFRAVARARRLGKPFVNFTLGTDGKVASMKVDGFTEFVRRPDPADTTAKVTLSESQMAALTGAFE